MKLTDQEIASQLTEAVSVHGAVKVERFTPHERPAEKQTMSIVTRSGKTVEVDAHAEHEVILPFGAHGRTWSLWYVECDGTIIMGECDDACDVLMARREARQEQGSSEEADENDVDRYMSVLVESKSHPEMGRKEVLIDTVRRKVVSTQG